MLIQMKVREEHKPHLLRVSDSRGPLVTCRCGSRVVFTLEEWGEHTAWATVQEARGRVTELAQFHEKHGSAMADGLQKATEVLL